MQGRSVGSEGSSEGSMAGAWGKKKIIIVIKSKLDNSIKMGATSNAPTMSRGSV